jgi:hypothetical protein
VNGEKGRYRYRTSLASAWTGFIHIKELKSWPPSDGAFVRVKESGEIYRIAGGAPIYVSDWAGYGGPQATQNITRTQFDSLPKVPKNGTHIRGQSSGDVYTIAHGAPVQVASWAGVGGEKPTIGVDDAAIRNAGHGGVWRFLRSQPADGFLRGATSYRIFRVVEGRPYYVSSWGPYGGEQPYVTVDDASVDSCNHLNCDPVGGFDSVRGGRGNLMVVGWAQDPNTASPLDVHVYIDGAMAGVAKTTRDRTDLETKYHRGITYGYEGRYSAIAGTHEVCTYAINAGAGVNNSHLGCRKVTVAALSAFTSQPVPTIAGVTRVNETLTVTAGAWRPAAKVTFQWKANGNAIRNATGGQLRVTNDLAGKTISVVSTATLDGYTPTSKSSSATVSIAALAAYTAAPNPTVAGSAKVGSTLTANVGAWKPGVTSSTVSWLRDGSAIPKATTNKYVLTPADMGKKISFSVTSSTRGFVTTTRTSLPTAAVVGLGFSAAPVPAIAGKAGIGQTLTAAAGTWGPAPVTLTYQWLRSGVPIPNATRPSYPVSASDVNRTLTVAVTGSRSGYAPLTQTSIATANIPPFVFTTVPSPTVSGTARVGQTLTAGIAGWVPAPSVTSYQWKRGGTAIPGGVSRTYVLTAQDAGQVITVTTNSAKAGYRSVIKTSNGTAKVLPAALTATPTPTISGSAKVGQTLTAKVAAWAPAPVTLGYQWNRNGEAIPNAIKNTYVLTATDKGAVITVGVSGSKPGYGSAVKTSLGAKAH